MAFEALNTAESRKKHLGIIEDVLAVNSYATPLLTPTEAVTLNGRSFTVATGNTTELKDYKRNKDNEFDHVEVEEKVYTLEEEKYWGRFVDQLDERDSNGQVNIEYVIARQAAEVVAPYLDKLRFDAALGNVSDNVVMGKTAGANNAYNAVLDVSEKLDELGITKERLLFVTPSFYKAIKSEIVRLPQGDADKKVLGKDTLANWMTTQSTKYLLNSCQMLTPLQLLLVSLHHQFKLTIPSTMTMSLVVLVNW